MRLVAQIKAGFYAAAPEAISDAASALRLPSAPFTLLDPCAGEGAAVGHLASITGCRADHTFAIELDESRGATLRGNLPEAKVVAPASLFGCRAAAGSFSLVWLNPPFDDEIGGGKRTEAAFLDHVTPWLAPGGVLMFVCPEDTVGNYGVKRRLMESYHNVTVRPFPESHRPYNEVTVLAVRRFQDVSSYLISWDKVEAPAGYVYDVPPARVPTDLVKTELTDGELARMVAGSPLRSLLTSPPKVDLPSPPLALGRGHVALLLASGHLDGVVRPEGGAAHAVRGTARKKSVTKSVTSEENDDGSTTTKTVLTERIELVVKAVGANGVVRTYVGE